MKMANLSLSSFVLLLLWATATAQDVRLVGGPSPGAGRLEVYHNGAWGTVCDDHFNNAAASVFCYMLGYGHTGRFRGRLYGGGRGRIWLDDVRCTGSETNISKCHHRNWGNNNCGHGEDVSISCFTARLTGGSGSREGRLEVYHNGTWGTVCDDQFTNAEAGVVCYMLGYGHGGYNFGNRYGAGSGEIWLTDVQCNGMELSIEDCQHSGWRNHSCDHSEDVSVSCTAVRLAGGSSLQEGRLELYHDGKWGTVCRNNFTHAAARVVCHMLGYNDSGQYIGTRYSAGSGQIWLDNVQCSGTEMNIASCQYHDWGNHDCRHDEDVSVSCFSAVRLVGDSSSKGRLEVYHNGTWGTVCANGFTDAAAEVLCHSLGYGHTGRFIGSAYGAGSGPIWLDNVHCNGSKSHIEQCLHSGWGHHNCSHSDDVSVSCIADSTESVALVGGENP